MEFLPSLSVCQVVISKTCVLKPIFSEGNRLLSTQMCMLNSKLPHHWTSPKQNSPPHFHCICRFWCYWNSKVFQSPFTAAVQCSILHSFLFVAIFNQLIQWYLGSVTLSDHCAIEVSDVCKVLVIWLVNEMPCSKIVEMPINWLASWPTTPPKSQVWDNVSKFNHLCCLSYLDKLIPLQTWRNCHSWLQLGNFLSQIQGDLLQVKDQWSIQTILGHQVLSLACVSGMCWYCWSSLECECVPHSNFCR